MFPSSLKKKLEAAPLIAVLVVDDPEDVVPLARALYRGGIRAVELTLRRPDALKILRILVDEMPELVVGAGTVLTDAQVEDVKAAGAAFGVSPGFNPSVVEHARELGLPFAPGVSSPSEVELAWGLGCNVLKLFPAESLGGIKYVKTLMGPYGHLHLKFIPLGGLDEENFMNYLCEPEILAVGGSWLTPLKMIRARAWNLIEERCRAACTRCNAMKKENR